MATTTTTTNKPLNPRAQDLSPKGYNRAALYSGKALDFDGVNDYVDLAGFTMSGSVASFSFYVNADNTGNVYFLDANPNRFVLRFSNNNVALLSGSLVEFDAIKANEWTHLVYVLNGTSAKCYANGVQLGTEQTITAIDLSAATDFDLGRWYLGGAYYDGGMANFKIFNTALTAAQVADLYNNPEKVVPTGVDNTALKLWLPMQEGAGTTAINGAPDALGSELVTNGDFATDSDWSKGTGWTIANGKASKVAGSATELIQLSVFPSGFSSKTFKISFNLEVTAGSVRLRAGLNNQSYLNSSGSYVYCLTPTGNDQLKFGADSSFVGSIDNVSVQEVSGLGTISGATWTHGIGAPVAQTSVIDWNKWTLDGSNDILIPQGLTSGRDLLGNLFESARNPYALNLDGKSWAKVHDNGSLDITDEVTLEAWVYYVNDASMLEHIIGKRASSGSWLRIYSASANSLRVERDGGAATSNVGITENAWSHIVATIDTNDTIRVYVNGTQQTSAASFTPWGMDNEAPVSIGAWVTQNGSVSPNSYTKGSIALPRIYNRALTATEVARNYNADKSKFGL